MDADSMVMGRAYAVAQYNPHRGWLFHVSVPWDRCRVLDAKAFAGTYDRQPVGEYLGVVFSSERMIEKFLQDANLPVFLKDLVRTLRSVRSQPYVLTSKELLVARGALAAGFLPALRTPGRRSVQRRRFSPFLDSLDMLDWFVEAVREDPQSPRVFQLLRAADDFAKFIRDPSSVELEKLRLASAGNALHYPERLSNLTVRAVACGRDRGGVWRFSCWESLDMPSHRMLIDRKPTRKTLFRRFPQPFWMVQDRAGVVEAWAFRVVDLAPRAPGSDMQGQGLDRSVPLDVQAAGF